jgi:uncharacterized protein YeaO (DUF488 family)
VTDKDSPSACQRVRPTRYCAEGVQPDVLRDSHRLLVCRYRPRGVRKETWDAWWPQLGPSRELHADYYGKHGPPVGWTEYRRRYLAEMKEQRERIVVLASRVSAGETITLLCSSACTNPERCHRTLLRVLVENRLGREK